jgi:hypothetical protein
MAGTETVRSPDTEVPTAPLTEVLPAPEVRYDLAPDSDVATVEAPAAEQDDAAAATYVVAPRPSETVAGSQGPLHTAEDANTQVDISSLSPDDAERIIAAADAEKRAHPVRSTTLRPASSALPPPPPLRGLSSPPVRAVSSPPGPAAAKARAPAQEPAGPPRRTPLAPTLPSARSSYPPPPPPPPPQRRGNTLLLYGGSTGDAAAKAMPGSAEGHERGSGHVAPTLISQTATSRAGEGQSTVHATAPAAAGSVEELGSDLLMDEGDELEAQGAFPAQAISSTSLVEDPASRPDLPVVDEPPPLSPFALSPSVPPTPVEPPAASPEPAAPAIDSPQVAPEGAALPEASGEPPVVLPPPEVVPLGVPFEVARVPPLEETTALRLPVGRRPWFAAVAILAGVLALTLIVGVFAFVLQRMHARATPDQAVSNPAASASAARAAASRDKPAASSAAATPGSREAAPRLGAPCVLAGAPHVVAPRALLRTGIETASTTDRIAIGVALGDRDGLVVALDPSTFASDGSARAHAADPLRRVVPILAPLSELTAFLETNRRHVPLEAAHPVAAHPSFVVGVSDGAFVWAPGRSSAPTKLWPLGGDGPVDAVRAIVLPGNDGYAIAFRQGTSIYLGALHADKTVNGDLARIPGMGPQIGSPAMAAGSRHLLVAWADRPTASAPWAIRWARWQPGTEPELPSVFPVPPGGGGGQVMAPALATLSDGRFVVVWTEGGGARHEVRAQALDSSEQPIGTAITVSADGVNAGQGMPALTPDGRGAVVFLATPTGATASVVAVPILCPGGS